MKKMRTKLFTTVAMLTVSAITLSTASYAWFTMQKTATVSEFSLTATAPTSIQIANKHSAGDNDWGSNATITLTGMGKLIPASSANGFTMFDSVDKTTEGPIKAGANAFKTASIPVSADVNGYYLDIPLSFRTLGTTEVANLYLDTVNSKIVIGNGTKAIFKATRISFLNKAKDGTAVTGATTNIWAPLTNDSKVATGLDAASDVATVAPQNIFTTNTAVVPKLLAGTASLPGAATEITVRVWIEGQDTMCKSLNAGGDLKITLVFKDTIA